MYLSVSLDTHSCTTMTKIYNSPLPPTSPCAPLLLTSYPPPQPQIYFLLQKAI